MCARERTFCELAAVELACFELDGDDVSERLVEELNGDAEACVRHGVDRKVGVDGEEDVVVVVQVQRARASGKLSAQRKRALEGVHTDSVPSDERWTLLLAPASIQ